MSESYMPALEARLIELETRVTFLEHGLLELNQALTDTRLEAARTMELLQHMLHDVSKLQRALPVDPVSEPPPPHY